MKKLVIPAAVFVASLTVGWATAPSPAACRSCQQRTCSSNRSCGEHCNCTWPDGKDYKQGVCVRMDD